MFAALIDFYEKCTTKYGEHSRRLKDDKTNTKGIEIFFFYPRGWKKILVEFSTRVFLSRGTKKMMFWSLGCQIHSFEIVWFFVWFFLGRHIDMSYYYSSGFFVSEKLLSIFFSFLLLHYFLNRSDLNGAEAYSRPSWLFLSKVLTLFFRQNSLW